MSTPERRSPREPGRRALLVAVLGVALAARLLAFLPFRDNSPRFDEAYYVHVAVLIAQGAGHAENLEDPEPTALRGPLLPALLASAIWGWSRFSEWVPIPLLRGTQLLPSLLTVLLVFQLCARRFGSRAALVSGLACALSPTLVHYGHFLWAENLGATLLAAFFWALDRFDHRDHLGDLALAGLLLGLLALAKPVWVYFAPVAAGWLIYRSGWRARRAAPAVATLLLAVSVVILPWTARNYAALGEFVLVSNMGWWPIAIGNLEDQSREAKVALMDEARRIPDRVERDRFYRASALRSIAEQQPWWLLRKLRGVVSGLYNLQSQQLRFLHRGWLELPRPAAYALLATDLLGTYLTMIPAILALWLVPGGRLKPLLVLAVLYLHAVHVIANAIPRYHVVLLPLYFLYLGPLVTGRPGRASAARWRRAGAAASLALFLAVPLPRSLTFLGELWAILGGS